MKYVKNYDFCICKCHKYDKDNKIIKISYHIVSNLYYLDYDHNK